MAALFSALLALARALPAIESLFRQVVKQIDAERERVATQRHAEKDARVDDAIAKATETK
jgi:hypothetical protein